MNDDQLLRYSRQIMLPQIGIEGQQQINKANILVLGMGGLGSPVAMYLAAAGIGNLTLVDDDVVDTTNLQRQLIHHTDQAGNNKTRSAAKTIRQLNPEVNVECIEQRLHGDELTQAIDKADIVVDCTDNFNSRFEINRACFQQSRPLVSAAAIQFEGHLSVFDFRDSSSPCYQCLYPQQSTSVNSEETCSETGILGPVVGTMGCMQALEVLKLITRVGKPLTGKLLIFDALSMDFRHMNLRKDPACECCSNISSR